MSNPLRVLIVEDCEADALLMLHELRQAGYEPDWRRVDDEASYVAALEAPLDLICADYRMPQFDAAHALELLVNRSLDIPFIIVSGSIGEELAVAAMRQGAADYLLKDRLARLGPAVAQALEQKRLRDEKARMDQALKDYLSMLAHELRNPLAPLLTSLEVAQQSSTDLRTRQQALDTIGRSVRQLARLVDDLLEATRIRQGGIPLQIARIDLARLARVVTEDRQYIFDRAGLHFDIHAPDTPVWVMGIVGLIPALSILRLLGLLYSLYLLYLGLPTLMRVPQHKVMGYTVVVIICAVVLFFLIGVIAAQLGGGPVIEAG